MPRGDLSSPAVTRALLEQAGVRPSRARGQNFLIDSNVLSVIERIAKFSSEMTVIEVGAGLGALTELLADRCASVYALESDRRLFTVLETRLGDRDNVRLLHEDASHFDFDELRRSGGFKTAQMVSNLPYSIAGSLVVDCLIKYPWIVAYTVMVQREVADRMTAKPGGRDYSSATVKIKSRARVSRAAEVSRNCFYPRPAIDSAIVRIERLPDDLAADAGPDFDRIVTAAFSQRRKKLANSLTSGLDTEPAKIKAALAEIERGQSRAEELSPEEYAALARALAGDV